jgi:glycosyltransferase involved in cell wall biosynthesis
MVGATWPHKNAHELLNNSDVWSNKYRLKIVLGDGPYRRKLEYLAEKRNLNLKIDFLNYQERDALLNLYKNSKALVYPSIMEGFGIPPLEAMLLKIPVLVSEIQIFKEIYGEAPIYVRLGDKNSWVRAFETLNKPQEIETRIQMGLEKASNYTIENTCAAFINSIDKVWPNIFDQTN